MRVPIHDRQIRESSTEKLRVFISYSRQDSAAIKLLVGDLITSNFEVNLDLQDILPGEPWQDRLGILIERAHTVIVALSPDFAVSLIAGWETKQALTLGKRILPILIRDIDPRQIPDEITRLNYVHLRGGDDRVDGIAKLIDALSADLGWLRAHTRLSEQAANWVRGNMEHDLLLRGIELRAAEAWLSLASPPRLTKTRLQTEFIRAGRTEESTQATRNRRTKVALLGLLVTTMLAALYVAWTRRDTLEFNTRLLIDKHWSSALAPLAERSLAPGDRFKECSSCPEMVVLPTGAFSMGSPIILGRKTELPNRMVEIRQAIAVSRFEITFTQWDACVAHLGCSHRPDDMGRGRGLMPVANVNWDDAVQYVVWLSKQTDRRYRLLSEAEWEYAARSGSLAMYPWGEEFREDRTNCSSSGHEIEDGKPSEIGSYPPNAFGLYDMIGNVMEWVQDPWHPNYAGGPKDGSVWVGGDEATRVLRGGSYANSIAECHTAFRDFARPRGFRNYFLGVRVARMMDR